MGGKTMYPFLFPNILFLMKNNRIVLLAPFYLCFALALFVLIQGCNQPDDPMTSNYDVAQGSQLRIPAAWNGNLAIVLDWELNADLDRLVERTADSHPGAALALVQTQKG